MGGETARPTGPSDAGPVPSRTAGRQAPAAASRASPGWAASSLGLQRSAGNAAVARMVAVQRDLAKAKASQDLPDIADVTDFSAATVADRMAFLGVLERDGQSYPTLAPAAIQRIWQSFGPEVSDVAGTNLGHWTYAVQLNPQLRQLPAVQSLRTAYVTDVHSMVDANITDNEAYLADRRKTLGLDGPSPLTGPESDAMRQNVQALAWACFELRQQQQKMRTIHVGYTDGDIAESKVMFDPQSAPAHAAGGLFDSDPTAHWADVKKSYDEAEGSIAANGAQYPELYGAAQADDTGDALRDLSRRTPESFAAAAGAQLDGLTARLADAKSAITSNQVDILALAPVQQRVLAGKEGATVAWQQPFPHWVGADVASEHDGARGALSAVLKTVEVTAMVVAPFTEGLGLVIAGLAGAGAAALQAGIAESDAQRLNTISRATPLRGSALVERAEADKVKAQADAAVVGAVVALLLSGAAGVAGAGKLIQAARLRQLIGDAALAARLGKLVDDGAVLEQLIAAAGGDAAELERVLLRVDGDVAAATKMLADRAAFRDLFADRYSRDIANVQDLKAKIPELAGLADEELVALRGYTGAGADYKSINRGLRGQSFEGKSAEQLQAEYRPYVDTMKSGLEQFPDYAGRVTRGENGTHKLYQDCLAQNKPFVNDGFLSTSKGGAEFDGSVEMSLDVTTGKDISGISRIAKEQEVLLAPGKSFAVVSVTRKGTGFAVHLREL